VAIAPYLSGSVAFSGARVHNVVIAHLAYRRAIAQDAGQELLEL